MGVKARDSNAKDAGIASDGAQQIPTGFRNTELGLLPTEWAVRSLGELGQSLIGLTYDPQDIDPSGVLVLRSSNIGNNSLQFGGDVYVKTDIPDRIVARRDDLLICVRNGSRPLIGKCTLIDERAVGMTFGAFMSVFRSDDNRFVFHCFQSDIIKRQINEHLGATINQITNKSLNSFKIPYPERREREAITAALSDIDKFLGTLEALIAKKQAIRQTAMRSLLTGEARLPGFSGEWERRHLADCGVFQGGTGFPLVFQGQQSGDYPFFKVSDLSSVGNEYYLGTANNWVSEDSRKALGAIAAAAGSIVFAKIGAAIFLERKRLTVRSSCLDNNLMAFSLTGPKDCEKFFYYLFCRLELGKMVSATALPALSGHQIGQVVVSVPSFPEQRAISAALSDIDHEISGLERRRAKTLAIKQGMMQELLTGRTRLI